MSLSGALDAAVLVGTIIVDEPVGAVVETGSSTVEVVARGLSGPPGPPGPPGPIGETYLHVQNAPSASWLIAHNQGRRPSVQVFSGDAEFIAVVRHLDLDVVVIETAPARAGYALLT